MEKKAPEPRFFKSAAEFRRWLEANHGKATELWLGFWKAASGKKGLTYEQAVEESLCYGWIDGWVKGIDGHSYRQRFTPRKPKSIWSAINIGKAEALKKAGRMAAPGLAVYEGRDAKRAGLYSFESRDVKLSAEFEKRFRANKVAWKFFEAQPPGYRRLMGFWVMSAKKEETRERRFTELVTTCKSLRRIRSL